MSAPVSPVLYETGALIRFDDLIMNMTACEIIAELQGSWVYTVIIAGKLIISTLGAIFSAYQWRKRGVAWLIHSNSKTLFSFYYGLIFAIGVVYSVLYGFEFGRLRFPCFVFDFRILLIIRATGMSAIVASHFVMVSISIERLYSSVFPLHFEKFTRRIVAVFVSSTIISFYVITFIFIPTSIFFCIDLYMNFYSAVANTKNVPLAVAYQYSENRMVISTLVPIEVTNAFLTIAGAIAVSIYNAVDPDTTYIARSLFVEISSLWCLYPLIFACLLEWRLRMRKQLKIGDLQRAQESHSHFGALQSQWS